VAADVAVIGSGVIGRTCAWRLQRAGFEVTVFDPHPASGATYVAAGMLAPVTEAVYGEQAVVELALRAAESWPGFAAELWAESGLDCGYRRDGTLLVAADASDRAHLDELQAFHHQLGLDSVRVGPTQARELEPLLAPGQRGGIFAAGDAQVDNRRLLAALFAACRRHGVQERRETVRRLLTDGSAVTGLETESGTYRASMVLLAAGYRSIAIGGLDERFVPPTRPVKGQIMRLRARPGAPELSVTVRALVAGSSIYVVPRGDGRVVVGATMEELGPDETVTAGGVYQLLRDALRVLPALAEYELVEAQAGLRPGSPDNAAIVGETGLPGLAVATGHHRNGILFAPTTAEAILSLIEQGTVPAFASPLSPQRFA
jgi:glycine oxidase